MDLFFDESGFTGRALLDPVQPHFSVASTNLTAPAAAEILSAAFPHFQGREMKFGALWRRPGNRGGFLRLARLLGDNAEHLFVWLVDKRFCVLQKLIDFLIEPLVHASGMDFYADAHAVKFSNYVHFQLVREGGTNLYVAATDAYYRFVRSPSNVELEILCDALLRMRNSGPGETRWFFDTAHTGAQQFHRFHDVRDFADTTEIQLSCVLASVAHWRATLPDDFRILHDDSRNFFAQQEIWDVITADEVPPQLHHGGFGPPMEFPLRISQTLAADSREHPSIQLCDLFAGLTNKVTNPRPDEMAFADELIGAGLNSLTMNGLTPRPNFPDGPPRPLDGPDVVDQLVRVMNLGLARP